MGSAGGGRRRCGAHYNHAMVRREEAERTSKGESEVSSCTSPTGESPVPVSAGAPGSRSAVRAEMPEAEAGRQEPLRREQERGPQHEVKPAASTELQGESRAAHVTAKATSRTPRSGGTRVRGLSGVGSAARVEGEVRNTRDPSARSLSRQGGSYKPKAKSSAVQRKSEGIVVARMGTKNNVTGGKGPCGDRDEGEGKRKGMAGRKGRSNHPDRLAIDQRATTSNSSWGGGQAAAGAALSRVVRPDLEEVTFSGKRGSE